MHYMGSIRRVQARALGSLLLASLNAHGASCAENFISRSNKFPPGDGLAPLRAEIYVVRIFFPFSYADFLSAGIRLELRGLQAPGDSATSTNQRSQRSDLERNDLLKGTIGSEDKNSRRDQIRRSR